MRVGVVLLLAIMAAAATITYVAMPQEASAERPIDVLVYGYNEDGTGPISAEHMALLESKGYTVSGSNGPADADEMKDAKVVLVWKAGDIANEDTPEVLTEYVYGGGRLLLLVDTPYAYCTSGSEHDPCHFDFTREAFGFKFDGDVQYSILYPAPGQENHPVWNVPNQVSEFSDWCCDAYVGEIEDEENITVLSTVSGDSYGPTGYSTVQNVPAIIVNNNPNWNGGMVIGAGLNMITGWQGPDTRMFENVIEFMLYSGTDRTAPAILGVDNVTIPQEASAERPIDVLVYGYNEDGTGPISAEHMALLESKGYTVSGSNGPADADEMKDAKVVLVWKAGDIANEDTPEVLTEYVYGGGRLLLLVDTPYAYCTSGSEHDPCHFDFTREAFGFKFDGDVQYSILYPAPGQENHPVWNVPNQVSEFSDWCCDAYVGEIEDEENITVLSTVSGDSYGPTGYSTVQNVPAIIVNNNPNWNGGMVIGAGLNMITGWQGPDTRMFENVIEFMLYSGTDRTAPAILGVDNVTIPQEASTERSVDVLVYGYKEDGTGAISAEHMALLESKGYTVRGNNGPADADEMKDAKVVLGLRVGDIANEDIRKTLTEYVYGGGRLLLLVNTYYQYCISGSEYDPCHFDFTREAFGFKFDGSVQYSTIYPAPGQENHPLWNVPNQVSEFSDWCCDAYVGEIEDEENITVLSTVSGESYRPTGYYTVQDVPAIIVNNNPNWNGGMVIGAGTHMIIGWHGPDTRMFENVLEFMLYDGTDRTAPAILGVNNMVFEADGPLTQISLEMIGNITAKDWQDPYPSLTGYALTFAPAKTAYVGNITLVTSLTGHTLTFGPWLPKPVPFLVQETNSLPVGTTIITWFARDAYNNVSTEIQYVTVQDTTPPVMTAPVDVVFETTGMAMTLTDNDYGTTNATDLVDPTPAISHDALESFPVGDTVITWRAIDLYGNFAKAVQTVTVTRPGFETISDGFEDGEAWDEFGGVASNVTSSESTRATFNGYEFGIDQGAGSPSPSARISGDGFASYAGIQREINLEFLGKDNLFVGIDYMAEGGGPFVVNADIQILDEDGSLLHESWLGRGGIPDTEWQTFYYNVTDAVSGHDAVTVKLGVYDSWVIDWNVNVHFDNFYVGTAPP